MNPHLHPVTSQYGPRRTRAIVAQLRSSRRADAISRRRARAPWQGERTIGTLDHITPAQRCAYRGGAR